MAEISVKIISNEKKIDYTGNSKTKPDNHSKNNSPNSNKPKTGCSGLLTSRQFNYENTSYTKTIYKNQSSEFAKKMNQKRFNKTISNFNSTEQVKITGALKKEAIKKSIDGSDNELLRTNYNTDYVDSIANSQTARNIPNKLSERISHLSLENNSINPNKLMLTTKNASTNYSKYIKKKAEHIEMKGVVFFKDKLAENKDYDLIKKCSRQKTNTLDVKTKRSSDKDQIYHRPSQYMINYAALSRAQKLSVNEVRQNKEDLIYKNTYGKPISQETNRYKNNYREIFDSMTNKNNTEECFHSPSEINRNIPTNNVKVSTITNNKNIVPSSFHQRSMSDFTRIPNTSLPNTSRDSTKGQSKQLSRTRHNKNKTIQTARNTNSQKFWPDAGKWNTNINFYRNQIKLEDNQTFENANLVTEEPGKGVVLTDTEINFQKLCNLNKKLETKISNYDEEYTTESVLKKRFDNVKTTIDNHFNINHTKNSVKDLNKIDFQNRVNRSLNKIKKRTDYNYENAADDNDYNKDPVEDAKALKKLTCYKDIINEEEAKTVYLMDSDQKLNMLCKPMKFNTNKLFGCKTGRNQKSSDSTKNVNPQSCDRSIKLEADIGNYLIVPISGYGKQSERFTEEEAVRKKEELKTVYNREVDLVKAGDNVGNLRKAFENHPTKNLIIIVHTHIFKNSLFTFKFTHINRPKFSNLSFNKDSVTKFIEKIREKLNLHEKYQYLYNKSGKHIKFLKDIQGSDLTLLISKVPDFTGLLSYYNPEVKEEDFIGNYYIEKFNIQIEKIEAALLKKGELVVDKSNHQTLRTQNEEREKGNVVVVNNIISLLEKFTSLNTITRDWNYYSKSGIKYVPPKKVKNFASENAEKALRSFGILKMYIDEGKQLNSVDLENLYWEYSYGTMKAEEFQNSIKKLSNRNAENLKTISNVENLTPYQQTMLDNVKKITNQTDYLESKTIISQSKSLYKLKFVEEMYKHDIKQTGDLNDMQQLIEKHFQSSASSLGIKRTETKEGNFFDQTQILKIMGDAQSPILKHAQGDKFNIMKVYREEDILNETAGDDDEFMDSDKKISGVNSEFYKLLQGEISKNYIEMNKKAVSTSKSISRDLQNQFDNMLNQNIPNIQYQTKFSRRDLYSFFIQFKAQCQITSQRHANQKKEVSGIDFHTFRNGIYQIAIQSDEIASRIFFKIDRNCKGFIDWGEFLYCMTVIKAKTLSDKINLFIKIADTDGNGLLSFDEVICLTEICLSKFVNIEESEDENFLQEMSEYFARQIFETCETDVDDEIPFEKIRTLILEKHPNSNQLCMFCGADQ